MLKFNEKSNIFYELKINFGLFKFGIINHDFKSNYMVWKLTNTMSSIISVKLFNQTKSGQFEIIRLNLFYQQIWQTVLNNNGYNKFKPRIFYRRVYFWKNLEKNHLSTWYFIYFLFIMTEYWNYLEKVYCIYTENS